MLFYIVTFWLKLFHNFFEDFCLHKLRVLLSKSSIVLREVEIVRTKTIFYFWINSRHHSFLYLSLEIILAHLLIWAFILFWSLNCFVTITSNHFNRRLFLNQFFTDNFCTLLFRWLNLHLLLILNLLGNFISLIQVLKLCLHQGHGIHEGSLVKLALSVHKNHRTELLGLSLRLSLLLLQCRLVLLLDHQLLMHHHHLLLLQVAGVKLEVILLHKNC